VTHVHLPTDEIVERLRETPLFANVEDGPLRGLVARGEVVDLAPGEVLIREGDEADALFVVLDGELEVSRQSGESRIPLAVVGPGALQGEIAALEGGRRLATVAATRTAEVLRIPVDALRELLATGPDVSLAVVRTAVARLRALESTLREREKLAALGTLSAGLAHELNNPAAAALRSVAALEEAVSAAETLPRPSPPPRPPAGTEPPRSALDRADRISELEAIAGSAEAASALVEAGWTADALRDQPADVVPWLAADASVRQLLGELELALTRISDIVGAVKGYSYLDQAPVGRVDVRIGLEQTLVILRHRLRDVEVRTEIADDLPQIEAFGSELNQVWTNLIDNAVDAMDGHGTLIVRAVPDPTPDGIGVMVTIADSGAGIPPEIRDRLFEPFFTTKEPGRGTGLGLHISHGVVARHGGRIEVESEPGDTRFRVALPPTLPQSSVGPAPAAEGQPASG
jgi:signal transduction histidine kinase